MGEASMLAVASLRTPTSGKRAAVAPPALGDEVEAKARRTEMYYTYHIEQHVVMLQGVVQQFEVHGRCELNQEQMQEIWKLIQEIVGHLYSVARFAGQGLEEQETNNHVLKQAVEYLNAEVTKCRSMASTAAHATEKQDEIMSKLRTRLERTQSQMERVSGLLDGITTPVKEIFSQSYDTRIQLDGLTARIDPDGREQYQWYEGFWERH
eukprot:5249195-Amphidinium_carterae.1